MEVAFWWGRHNQMGNKQKYIQLCQDIISIIKKMRQGGREWTGEERYYFRRESGKASQKIRFELRKGLSWKKQAMQISQGRIFQAAS